MMHMDDIENELEGGDSLGQFHQPFSEKRKFANSVSIVVNCLVVFDEFH